MSIFLLCEVAPEFERKARIDVRLWVVDGELVVLLKLRLLIGFLDCEVSLIWFRLEFSSHARACT